MPKVADGRVLVSQNGAKSYRGQSSWPVVLRGWCLYSMVVTHVFTETYNWGKPRSMSGQMYGGGVSRTRVGGHETRPKPKPNVDYYLVTYYYYYYYYY